MCLLCHEPTFGSAVPSLRSERIWLRGEELEFEAKTIVLHSIDRKSNKGKRTMKIAAHVHIYWLVRVFVSSSL